LKALVFSIETLGFGDPSTYMIVRFNVDLMDFMGNDHLIQRWVITR
jgi:hypothetical protein